MSTILDEIAAHKRETVAEAKRHRPLDDLRRAAADTPPTRDFRAALTAPGGVALIAEIKKASPSQGVFREDFDPAGVACIYAENGARALSVLTDERYFQGGISHLQAARAVCDLPVLRKDFTVDAYQLYEARTIGADAVLLIVALLGDGELSEYLSLSGALGLAALVEVHTAGELRRALYAGAEVIGVNNRDLRTFQTSLQTTFDLVPSIPEGRVVVSESGIGTRADVLRLREAGIHAVLVGEALIRERDIGAKVRELSGR